MALISVFLNKLDCLKLKSLFKLIVTRFEGVYIIESVKPGVDEGHYSVRRKVYQCFPHYTFFLNVTMKFFDKTYFKND